MVWRLTETESGVQLRRDLSRMSWVPEKVTFVVRDDPLTHVPVVDDWPAGTKEVADLLDGLCVPVDTSTRATARALKAAGKGRRDEVVRKAVRWRALHQSEGRL